MREPVSSFELLDKAELLLKAVGTSEVSMARALPIMGLTGQPREECDLLIENLTKFDLISVSETGSIKLTGLANRLLQDSWSQKGRITDGQVLGPSEIATFIAG